MKRTLYILSLFIFIISLCPVTSYAGEKLGKLHIKAGIANVGGQELLTRNCKTV